MEENQEDQKVNTQESKDEQSETQTLDNNEDVAKDAEKSVLNFSLDEESND